METLTLVQRRMLVFIENYTIEHHYPPSIEEIAAGVGLASKSSVSDNLKEVPMMEEGQQAYDKPRMAKVGEVTEALDSMGGSVELLEHSVATLLGRLDPMLSSRDVQPAGPDERLAIATSTEIGGRLRALLVRIDQTTRTLNETNERLAL